MILDEPDSAALEDFDDLFEDFEEDFLLDLKNRLSSMNELLERARCGRDFEPLGSLSDSCLRDLRDEDDVFLRLN